MPECIVNGVVHWGQLEPQTILATICQGYPRAERPAPCDCVDAAGASAYANCLAGNTGGGGGGGGSKSASGGGGAGMPWYGVLLLVVSIIVVMLLAGLAYWKHTQKQMRDQVRGILAEYLRRADNPKSRGDAAAATWIFQGDASHVPGTCPWTTSAASPTGPRSSA